MAVAALLLVALLMQAATPGQTTRTPPRDPRVATTPTGSSIIRGQVVDATNGAPIRRATVRIFGAPFRENPPSTVTDDEGRFELRDLPAGKFTVTAMKAGYFSGGLNQTRQTGPPPTVEVGDKQIADKLIVRMTRGGVIVGRVMDEAGEPAINVELRAMQYQYGPGGRTLQPTGNFGMIRSDDLGGFRIYGLVPGQYYVVARPSDGFFGPPAAAGVGPANTFYPSSPDVTTAQRVTVAAGRETGPVLITLVSTKLSRVRGRAIMSNGQPFSATYVNAMVREDFGTSGRSGGRTTPDGSFEIAGLPPGTYELEVRPQSFGRDDDAEVARQTITVNGDDIDGLLLIGAKPGIVRGKVITDDGTAMGYAEMTIMAQVPGPGVRFYSPPTRVKDDLTFELKGLFGQGLFRLGGFSSAPSDGPPWILKAVMLNGVDIIDKPIDIAPGAVIEGLEMVFTRKAAELSGTVTISGGARLEEASIVLFPADESLWRDTTRFVRIARPDKEGIYKFTNLTAHDDYLLVTAVQLEPGQHMDPDFLKSVRDRAMRLSLYEGEKRVQNIRIAATAQ